jgi:signal transduction histidine kinase
MLPDIPLTADIRHNLFMVLKEALNNIVKHANASEVSIQIAVEAAKFTITIKDNGKGFELEPTPNGDTRPHRNGLTNMHKRMESLNGQCKLDSHPGQGTQVELTVYLRNK